MAIENKNITGKTVSRNHKSTKPIKGSNTPISGKENKVGKDTPNKTSVSVKKQIPVVAKTERKKQLATKKKGTKKPVKSITPKKEFPEIAVTSNKAKVLKPDATKGLRKLVFQIRFHTHFGQELFVVGDHPLLGNNLLENAVPLNYFNEDYWFLELDLSPKDIINKEITYHYVLRNQDATFGFDWGIDKRFNLGNSKSSELLLMDAWNFAGYFENTFYTEPFTEVLLKDRQTEVKTNIPKKITHILKVKTPLLSKGQTLCLLGSSDILGNWQTTTPIKLGRVEGEDFYSCSLDLSGESFPIAYKYGVYDIVDNQFVRYEDGNNRTLHDAGKKNRITVLNDGFALLPGNNWKGAGMAIPVFSLRTEKSFGIGEFTDLPLAVDWALEMGLKMIQLLPINDTTATHTWMDSYPYAAISAFALHPVFLNLEKISVPATRKKLKKLEPERIRLNNLTEVDYVAVAKLKWEFATEVYETSKKEALDTSGFKQYFEKNKHWLVPYAAFCYLRDQYGTVDFSKWPAYKLYNAADIAQLTNANSPAHDDIGLHYFIQYQLHLQLKEATAYAHERGVIVKGDIAIGVYRHGADAWQNPELYHLGCQAGAPPDDFAIKGQNWGFPTYDWKRMKEDGFAWWKQRFEQMSYYFDAFRIDHILGFFRIWSIPMHAVQGIMGHFVPAIPVNRVEFDERGIWFDKDRYTMPFITEKVLWQLFGYDNELVKSLFLQKKGNGNYSLLPAYATQRQVDAHFATLEKDTHHERIQRGLYDLISNVILFESENTNGKQFHFRFGMESTASFQNLGQDTQEQLKALYNNYFFERQDDFWKREALQKLPALKRETNMLVCGEDLGLVPSCVPDVMRQLGLLSLEIQRMPKQQNVEFFHPNDAPYLSVVTPSTHDMSTIRGWWEEDRDKTQRFYNHQLGQMGEAPHYCEAWINKAIVVQHLFSPAMWSIFQVQDLLGSDEQLRRENPGDERINIPADPKHYWRYRMHINLESLRENQAFNTEMKKCIVASGR